MRGWDAFDSGRFAGGQMRRFPIHRHPDPGAATWMIEKDEFFQRRRIEFAEEFAEPVF